MSSKEISESVSQVSRRVSELDSLIETLAAECSSGGDSTAKIARLVTQSLYKGSDTQFPLLAATGDYETVKSIISSMQKLLACEAILNGSND